MLAAVEENTVNEPTVTLDRKLVLMPQRQGVEVGNGDTRKVIDPNEVYKLAKLHGSLTEMADFFGITRQTLVRHFEAEIAKGRAETKQAIRRAQIELALAGNAPMLMWCGRNILGQTDRPEQEQEDKAGVTFTVNTIKADTTIAEVTKDKKSE